MKIYHAVPQSSTVASSNIFFSSEIPSTVPASYVATSDSS